MLNMEYIKKKKKTYSKINKPSIHVKPTNKTIHTSGKHYPKL